MSAPLERCEQAQAAETEPLPVTLDHDCGPWCTPCARDGCGHHDGRHLDSDDECLVPGCDCGRWLADGDCPDCDATGAVTTYTLGYFGRELDKDVLCPQCGGTGTVAPSWRWAR